MIFVACFQVYANHIFQEEINCVVSVKAMQVHVANAIFESGDS